MRGEMRIDRLPFKKRAVVILGAGATRGASFVEELHGVLPPLDGDFFTQAQRLSYGKAKQGLRQLTSDVVGLFGPNFQLTMEGYLTRLEQLAHVHDDYRLVGRPRRNQYRDMRERFVQVLAAVLDEAIGRHPECTHHRTLVTCLDATDTVVSLNYDWLIDHTLKTHGDGKWNPKIGYGVPVYSGFGRGAGTRYWAFCDAGGVAQFPHESVKLLKLHGSITWFPVPSTKSPPKLELRKRWWHQRGSLRFEIAPPEWNKPTRSGVYVPVWREARKALREASGLVFIGYSLPETDLPVHALFRVDDQARRLELLVTVNPDQSARRRIRQALIHRIGKGTRVLSFEKLSEFAGFLSEGRGQQRRGRGPRTP